MKRPNIEVGVRRMGSASVLRAVMIVSLLFGLGGAANAQSRFIVTNPGDSGPGTLREAIGLANADVDRSSIDFNIDPRSFGGGPWTISLQTELPEFTAPVLVRGFSQPGSVASSSPLNSTYRIEIDDSALPGSVNTAGHEHGAMFVFAPGSEQSAVTGLAFVGARGSGSRVAILIITSAIAVRANRFGVRHDGRVTRYGGVAIGSTCGDNLVIGGTRAAEGNLIGGTERDAIMVQGSSHLIGYNWIGFDTLGISAAPSPGGFPNVINGHGILAGAIGVFLPPRLFRACSPGVQAFFFGLRTSTIRDNRISATRSAAIALSGDTTTHNEVVNNVLGQDVLLTNQSHVNTGVRLARGAARNTLRDNVIGNAVSGIVLGESGLSPSCDAGIGNVITGNRLARVTSVAIGLDANSGFQPLPNDPLDVDGGPNGLQNKPTLSVVSAAGAVEGSLESRPGQGYRIELFHSRDCQPLCSTSAQLFLGSLMITTDGGGRASFSARIGDLSGGTMPLGGLRAGDTITATATDAVAIFGTSELSDAATVQATVPVAVTVSAIASPAAAMTGPASITVSVLGHPTRVPTGTVELFTLAATGTRLLGSATLSNGTATIAAPTFPGSFFPQAGRFDLFARYNGDGFYHASESAAQRLVVFRPSIALRSVFQSAPIRRNLATDDLEQFDPIQNVFAPLASGVTPRLVDSERISTLPLDLSLLANGAALATLDGAGGVLTQNSSVINVDYEILDLVQADAHPHADALVRNRVTGEHALVTNPFERSGFGQRIVPIRVEDGQQYATSGDFNGDGITDLVFLEPVLGTAIVRTIKDAEVFSSLLYPRQGTQRPAAAADLNGDGEEELIWLDGSSGRVSATLVRDGTVIAVGTGALPAGRWSTPGSGHFATPVDPDYGRGHLVFANADTGEVLIWRNPRIIGNVLSVDPRTMFFDAAYVIERLR